MKFSAVKRGLILRKSVSSNRSGERTVPVRKPRPNGENGTSPMPNSRRVGMISASRSRVHSEYSDCSAVIGWVALARRMVAAEAADNPMWRTFSSAMSSATAPTVSSIGVFGSTRCG